MVKINLGLNNYIHLKRVNSNLQKDLFFLDSLCFCLKQISLRKDTIIKSEALKFETSNKINRDLQESFKAYRRKSRKTAIGVGACGIVLGSVLGVLLINN